MGCWFFWVVWGFGAGFCVFVFFFLWLLLCGVDGQFGCVACVSLLSGCVCFVVVVDCMLFVLFFFVGVC